MPETNYIDHVGYYQGRENEIHVGNIGYYNEISAEERLKNSIAQDFDEDQFYSVGDHVYYGKKLYKFISPHPTGAWSGNDVTQAAPLSDLFKLLPILEYTESAGFHNGIYRGKDITSYLTDGTLWDRINGSNGHSIFDDLYLGDYITVDNNSYAIVDFDYYIRCGNTDFNKHHLVMMPRDNMVIPEGTALYGLQNQTLSFINTSNTGQTVDSQETQTAFKWNATIEDPNTNTTAGGYKYSRMRTVIMKAANTIVVNAFGTEHVKPISVYYPNPTNVTANGITSSCTWFDQDDQSSPLAISICDLPNETQVYGQQIWGRGASNNPGYEIWLDKFQFALFATQRNFANTRYGWWLRSVYSTATATYINLNGIASYTGVASARGVRPRFILIGQTREEL